MYAEFILLMQGEKNRNKNTYNMHNRTNHTDYEHVKDKLRT